MSHPTSRCMYSVTLMLGGMTSFLFLSQRTFGRRTWDYSHQTPGGNNGQQLCTRSLCRVTGSKQQEDAFWETGFRRSVWEAWHTLKQSTHTHTHNQGASCQASQPDLSSVAALVPVLQAADMRHAFNFPLKCPGTTEDGGGSVCCCTVSLCGRGWLD